MVNNTSTITEASAGAHIHKPTLTADAAGTTTHATAAAGATAQHNNKMKQTNSITRDRQIYKKAS
jgi:hypothetical protein